MDDAPIILMTREQSTMVSSWTELLGIERVGRGKWLLAVYGYEYLGSIYDLIPEDQRYDEDGGFKVPDEYQGRRIRGLADGEYLETDKLIRSDDEEAVTFDKSSVALARQYVALYQWEKQPGFEAAWKTLMEIVGA
jgi:hypothetical protein